MEFYTLINKCLRKDPESRRRNLYIRTYVRLPMRSVCGVHPLTIASVCPCAPPVSGPTEREVWADRMGPKHLRIEIHPQQDLPVSYSLCAAPGCTAGPGALVVLSMFVCREKGLFMSGMDIKELWKSKMTDPM